MVLWLKPGGSEISFSSQTGPETDPAASTVGKKSPYLRGKAARTWD